MINASECANKTGKYAFGLDEARAVGMLRQLADDIENGVVALYSVTTSSHASHDEFSIRELVVEVLEEIPVRKPQVVRG